ncbi:CPBP family glutamic-type intramembrane protease [Pseudonocardia sp. CA-107938]|uniref:CPBP family glutamic-type intramembrane protease n=1 Tax=Pseudonocardia sp. CA-107938 TaxID=3240021 RepID=UPI003D93EF5F
MSTVIAWTRAHRLTAFFGLTFLISWAPFPFWALGLFPGALFPIGPLAAALIVIGLAEGRAGYRALGARLVRWRVGWRWVAVAALTPLAVLALASLANVAVFGAPAPVLAELAWGALALNFAVRWVDVMDGPAGEEPGYRGYAVPLLQIGRTPAAAAAVLGAIVAVWHVPLVVAGQLPLLGIAVTVVITVVYVWLFDHTGGSVLMTMLFHVLQGTVSSAALGFVAADAARMDVLTGTLWALLAAAILAFDRSMWRPAPAAATADRRREPVAA